MKPFRLSYNRSGPIILTIIFIPAVSIGLLITLLLNLPENTADWLIITIICIFLVLIAIGVIFIVTKKATVPCILMVNEHGISFKLQKSSFFYRLDDFHAGWESVVNISENYNTGESSFYSVTFKNPTFTANFSVAKGSEDEAEIFYKELIYYQEIYNLNHLNSVISSKNFYNTTWAKLVTWMCYIIATIVILLHLLGIKPVNYHQTASFVCFAILWFISYYKNTKKLY